MIVTNEVLEAIKTHVNGSPKREICGLICNLKRKNFYLPCRNISTGENEFILHPDDYAEAEDKYKILAVVHSHNGVNPNPSQADLIEIEANQIPYVIMNYPLNTWTFTEPSGYQAPYVGRQFVHGITDCYAIWRDYYKRELNIEMQDYYRQPLWWNRGDNLYMDYYESAGFVVVNDLKQHDIILMRIASEVPNHCAVHVGDGIILHHVQGKVSSREVYGGWYRKITTHILRHKSLC